MVILIIYVDNTLEFESYLCEIEEVKTKLKKVLLELQTLCFIGISRH